MERQGIPAIDLWLEQDTARCPEPCGWYLFVGAACHGPYATRRAGEAAYRQQRAASGYTPPPAEPPDARAILAAEAQDDRAARGNLYWDRIAAREARSHRR